MSTSNSTITGTAETSGAVSYVAGDGISISGGRISADVTQAELDAVGAAAESARKTASDAQAAAGRAQQTADGKAEKAHKHSKADVTDFPASMPASDVSAWAKAPTKPTYTAAEVGAAEKSHRHAWGEVTGKPTTYPPEAHTHPYAGSQSAGGAATSAAKLATARKITLAGAVNGSAAFDGSADVTITVEGDSAAAGFLAAHPVGFYATCKAGVDPNGIGGTWEQAPSVGPCVWAHTHPYAGSQSAGGAATSAAKLATARKITLAGAVTGSAAFDGSADVTIAVEGDSAAAGFLAAHPVGFYATCKAGVDPNGIGGTWEQAPSVGPCVWLRIK